MSNIKFKSNGATQVALIKVGSPYTTTVQYSKNGGAWSNVQFGTAISLSNNDTVSFSGNARFSKNIQNKYQFTTAGEGTLTLSGDLVSLVSSTIIEDDYEFNSLFKDCENIVDASQLTLPSNTTNWCYTNMFFGCTNLSAAPTFVSTEVKQWSYANMFVKCFALSSAPTLPTAIQNDHSCSNMFQSCISLTGAPSSLYTTQNGTWMYNAMFEGCIGLSSINNYFSVSNATPSGGYSSMFRNCINLSSTPWYHFNELKANCFNFLFDGAKKVDNIQVDFSNWSNATSSWVKDVSPTGTFLCPSALDTSVRSNNTVPINWNVYNYQTMPLTFYNVGTEYDLIRISRMVNSEPYGINIKYRKNFTGDWIDYEYNIEMGYGPTIQLNPGEFVSFSGNNSSFSHQSFSDFVNTTKLYVFGNMMSLVGSPTSNQSYRFPNAFISMKSLMDASKLFLPSVTPTNCYYRMFENCKKLCNLPVLSATSLTSGCYREMFKGCSGLVSIPKNYLPATSLANDCYGNMFANCTSLTDIPTSLLSATTLADRCYYAMFSGCANLQVAPYLPAPNTVLYCYSYMFLNCSKLSAVAVNFTNWNYYEDQLGYKMYYTDTWLNGTAANGSFYKPPSLPIYRGQNFIPIGWTVYNK